MSFSSDQLTLKAICSWCIQYAWS